MIILLRIVLSVAFAVFIEAGGSARWEFNDDFAYTFAIFAFFAGPWLAAFGLFVLLPIEKILINRRLGHAIVVIAPVIGWMAAQALFILGRTRGHVEESNEILGFGLWFSAAWAATYCLDRALQRFRPEGAAHPPPSNVRS